MIRRLSIEKRVERLEALQAERSKPGLRMAITETLSGWDGERHLAMISVPDAAPCMFQERPGPGRQLADFGKFFDFVHFPADEMKDVSGTNTEPVSDPAWDF